MLTLQQMIDGVLAGAEGQALSKIAQAADEREDKSSEDEGESKAPPKMSKAEAERQADKEEKSQGGGSDSPESEDTDMDRVEKMASAIEEVVQILLSDGESPEQQAKAAEGAPENATQMPTNLKQAPEGEHAQFGEANAKIPTNPPQEKVLPAEKGDSAMETNEDAQAKQAAYDPEAKELGTRYGAIGGGAVGALQGLRAGPSGAALGAGLGAGLGALGGRLQQSQYTQEKHPVIGNVGSALLSIPGTVGGLVAGESIKRRKAQEAAAQKAMAQEAAAAQGAEKTGSLQRYMQGLLEKSAADPSSPQAKLSAPKSDALPEDRPLNAPLAAGAEGQRAMLSSNEAALNLTKRKAKALPKQDLAALLSENALSRSTDKALDQTLGAQTVDQAGAKIASERKLKIAAARALISKIASEGCTCDGEGLRKGSCRFCKVASRLEPKEGANCASEKKAQVGNVQGASNVPPSVESSPMAGGAPQM